jgi:hypothetical protein
MDTMFFTSASWPPVPLDLQPAAGGRVAVQDDRQHQRSAIAGSGRRSRRLGVTKVRGDDGHRRPPRSAICVQDRLAGVSGPVPANTGKAVDVPTVVATIFCFSAASGRHSPVVEDECRERHCRSGGR